MTLPNNPFSAPSGVPHPSEAPAGTSSLPAPMSAPVMVAPVADPYGAAPLYAGPSNTARSSRSMHARVGAWMVIVLQVISLVHGFIPYQFDHLENYVSRFSNPMFWFWRLMYVIVIALAVLYLRKGASLRAMSLRASFWCCSSSSLRSRSLLTMLRGTTRSFRTARFTRWAPWVRACS